MPVCQFQHFPGCHSILAKRVTGSNTTFLLGDLAVLNDLDKFSGRMYYQSTISAGYTMIDREFFIGFIKIHILYHASKEPVFGLEIQKELERHGYRLSFGTLYPTLHRLSDAGYLSKNSAVINGRVRKYYRITDKGKKMLEQSRRQIRELVNEVTEENI